MGYLKIIIAILIWSSLGILVRKSGIPTVSIIFYPSVIAALLQLSLLSLTGQFKKPLKADFSSHRVLLFTLPVFSLLNVLLFYFAFTHTTIANAVLTHYTAPVFVALMAPVFLKEKIVKTTWIAIILSSLGLWLILGAQSPYEWMMLNGNERNGIIAGAMSGIAYAVIILILRSISSDYPALFITFTQNSIIALMLLPFIITIPLPVSAIPYLFVMGAVHSTIAPLLYVQGFRSVKANEAAILGYFEPVGAIILAMIFLHEVPDIKAVLGGALILYSGFMIVMSRKT